MGNFVLVDTVQDARAGRVAHFGKQSCELTAIIEVGLFEREAESGDKIQRRFHGGHRSPEVTAHGQFAELDAQFTHPVHIPGGVSLLVSKGSSHPDPESCGCLGKAEEHQRHQFGGQQLVVGKKMEQPPAVDFIFNPMDSGKTRV